MKRYIRSILSILLAVLVTTAVLQAQGGNDYIARQMAYVSEFDVNGLKVIVRKRPTAKTVSGGLFIKGGARNISSANAGRESFALSVAVEASKNFPRDILRRKLAKTGSSLGAGSSNDYSVINFATTSQDFENTWNAFADVVLNPSFNSDDVERVRSLILTALKNREDDADNYLDALQERIIYASHPYANDVNGTVSTISALKATDLRTYHKEILKTSKLLLVIVGNVEPDVVKAAVSKSFGKLPAGKYKERPRRPRTSRYPWPTSPLDRAVPPWANHQTIL